MSHSPKTGELFERLVEVMAVLRGPNGCPWDREQTHRTLTKYMLEEAYEAVEAIEADDESAVIEELGDVLLQVVFHAQIAREQGRYAVDDVIQAIIAKLIERHPHVFGEGDKLSTPAEVLEQWERNKLAKSEKRESIVDGLPEALPALQRAWAVQRKVAQVGFDWEQIGQVFDKAREELNELEQARADAAPDKIHEEFGDLLFSLVNLARYLEVDPEAALRDTIRKFTARFRHVEERVRASGKTLEEATLAEMDAYWDEAKQRA